MAVLEVVELPWLTKAACRGVESFLFFPPHYPEPREEKDAREAVAKEICASCAAIHDCRDYSLKSREPHGIWGGLNEFERCAVLEGRRTASA